MRNGECFQLPMQELPICGKESGLWHTPTVSDGQHPGRIKRKPHLLMGLSQQVNNPQYWPTPSASQARSEGMILQMRTKVEAGEITITEAEAMIGVSLTPARMPKWATPQASDWKGPNKSQSQSQSTRGLSSQVWRTPKATDGSNGGPNARDKSGSPHLSMQAGGSLNPMWVQT